MDHCDRPAFLLATLVHYFCIQPFAWLVDDRAGNRDNLIGPEERRIFELQIYWLVYVLAESVIRFGNDISHGKSMRQKTAVVTTMIMMPRAIAVRNKSRSLVKDAGLSHAFRRIAR